MKTLRSLKLNFFHKKKKTSKITAHLGDSQKL